MKTRATLLALVLGTTALTSAHAQNYEYDNPNWFDGEPTQPNLAQIGVTPLFHSNFKAYIDGSAFDSTVIVAVLDGLADFNHIDLNGQGSALTSVYPSRFRKYSDHGTHVSGIIGRRAKQYRHRRGKPLYDAAQHSGLRRQKMVAKDLGEAAFTAADNAGARVVNMSYGPASLGLTFDPAKGPPPGKGLAAVPIPKQPHAPICFSTAN